LKGLNKGGWKLDKLDWVIGDTEANLESMLNLSYDYISKAVPMIKDISYNFDTGRFVYGNDATGTRDIPKEIWADTAKSGRARAYGIGSNTLKRAALAHTILSKQRHDILAQLSGFGGFGGLSQAKGVFYSQEDTSKPDEWSTKEPRIKRLEAKWLYKFNRVRDLQEHISGSHDIPEEANAVKKEATFYGKTGEHFDKLERNVVDPMMLLYPMHLHHRHND